MVRYANQPLPERPRIAVLANDAIGNFVMATPVLQLLRAERNPSELHYYGGVRTKELQEASDLFDRWFNLQGTDASGFRRLLEEAGHYDLILNLESTALSKTFAGLVASEGTFVGGPSIGPGGRGDLPFGEDDRGQLWRDREWVRESLPSEYPFLQSGFISEIFVRLAYLERPLPPYRVASRNPERSVPDVLIATAASLPEKLWPAEAWKAAANRLIEQGLSVGLLGAPPAQQAAHWQGAGAESDLLASGAVEDLRGAFTLPEVVGALGQARLILTLDNGILHLAAATTTPTVGLFRHGIHRLWAPPVPNLTVLTPGEGRTVAEISVKDVLLTVERALG